MLAGVACVCVVLGLGFSAAEARPIIMQQALQIGMSTRDFFACRQAQASAIVCPKGAQICKCPAGFYGSLSKDDATSEWSGVCYPCPMGFWSAVGANVIDECQYVQCPQHAVNHPKCECEPDTVGELHWMACAGAYDGKCTPVKKAPLPEPPVTTIDVIPPSTIHHSSIVINFHSESRADDNGMLFQYSCEVDGVSVACEAPTLSLEKLSQGMHNVRIWATDRHGQQDISPPSATFEVDVPCPEHSFRHHQADSCVCQFGFFSSLGEHLPYVDGAYTGTCEPCKGCEAGTHRVACNATYPGVCVGCAPGMFKILNESNGVWNATCQPCKACEPGFSREDCGGDTDGTCKACTTGTFKLDFGTWDSGCAPCRSCDAGFELKECGMASEGSCEACPIHTYKVSNDSHWDAKCHACEPCDKGYYRDGCGVDTPGKCIPCEFGSYKSEGGPGSDWTLKCKPCVPCVQGEGGYRAHCGGPEGPGTCEVCAECVGSPVDSCFCDVVSA